MWGATYEVGDRFHLWGSIDRTTFEETIAFPEVFPSDFGDVPFLAPDLEILTLDIPRSRCPCAPWPLPRVPAYTTTWRTG